MVPFVGSFSDLATNINNNTLTVINNILKFLAFSMCINNKVIKSLFCYVLFYIKCSTHMQLNVIRLI